MAKQKTPAFSAELLLDHLLDGQDPTTVPQSDGLIGELKKALKKALAGRMLNAEMDVHLDAKVEHATGNHRNLLSPMIDSLSRLTHKVSDALAPQGSADHKIDTITTVWRLAPRSDRVPTLGWSRTS